jgi:ABC-type transporter Mla MlaB component
MLKISEGKSKARVLTLRLEGRIVGPWVEELRHISEAHVSDGSLVALDLADVTFADDSGVALLMGLQKRAVKLLNAAPFVEEQLRMAATHTD